MNISYSLMAAFSFVGVINSIFVAIYLWFRKIDKPVSNRILSLILLAIALRVSKSLIYYLLNTDTNNFVITLGHTALSCIGPLLYFYILSKLKKEFRFKWIYSVHFLFSLIILFFYTWLMEINFSYLIRHSLILLQFIIYLLLSSLFLFKSYSKLSSSQKIINSNRYTQLAIMIGLLSLLWLVYLLHHIFNVVVITTAPILYSLCLYIMIFIYINRPDFLLSGKVFNPKRNVLTKSESKEILDRVVNKYESDKIFRDPDLTLTKLGKLLNMPPYKLSLSINSESCESFSKFTNRYRIEDAKIKLKDKNYDNRAILAIAYDSGFNSFSAFSSAFKIFTGNTPSQYQRN